MKIRFLQIVLLLSTAGTMQAQPIQITFRHVPTSPIFAVSLPGDFNGWNTSSGTAMTYVDSLDQWIRTKTFFAGETSEYKFFVRPSSSSSGFWTNDPNNPLTNPADNDNSVIVVTDPMLFQFAEQRNDLGLVTHYSVGVFGSNAVTSLSYQIGGSAPVDGLSSYNSDTGILRVVLLQPVISGTRFLVTVTTPQGSLTRSMGTLLEPVAWRTTSRKTTEETFRLRATVSKESGEADESVVTSRLIRNGEFAGDLSVSGGFVDQSVFLEPGENRFVLSAVIDGVEQMSSELILTRRGGPLPDRYFDFEITGSGFEFNVGITGTSNSPGLTSFSWTIDEELSTVSATAFQGSDTGASGTAEGPGEIFLDMEYVASDGSVDKARAAIQIAADGEARTYEYAETAFWIDQAVVYEIFPLSFGPSASGSEAAPGNKFNEIKDSLPYIAEMGFNTIWFMPIMKNQVMSELGGGYSITDFKQVDPTLGTNEDFRLLVQRAHELDIRIVLDITVNHVSPDHAWVESLKNDGDYPGFLQTTPSSHTRGLDGRGASLPEKWDDTNLYRVYDGFGNLANLNWDNDDLQADMLEVIEFWLAEFDVDGYRFDAYWGPWRRYGPDRFGVPIREVMRRVRPDAWALGELEGTGFGTEVYYADAVGGAPLIEGGIDSAYDWTFSGFVSQFSTYARLSNYRGLITNANFVPGPNARFFRFLENHDWTRIQRLYQSGPDRIRALTGMLLTVPGIPMIYQGQEVAYGAGSGDTRRLPVDWNTPENDVWAKLHRFLATARATYPAFGTQNIEFLSSPSSVLAFVRPYQDQNALVMINFSASARTFTVDPSDDVLMSIDGPIPYYDLLEDTVATHLGGFDVALEPFETRVFITDSNAGLNLARALPALPFGAIYTANETDIAIASSFELHQNYPNPFNPITTISFDTPSFSQVRIEIFDVLGRLVTTVANGHYSPGSHSVSFDASGLSSGTYLYRLTSERASQTRQMVLLK